MDFSFFWTVVGSLAGVAGVALAAIPLFARTGGEGNRSSGLMRRGGMRWSRRGGPPETPREKVVAVIHGRDAVAREAFNDFLRRLGLIPREWGEAVTRTGVATPFNLAAVEAQFQQVQAVIVLMTPDDEAQLAPDLFQENEEDFEKKPLGQPRQNVLIEAGMAFSRHPTRTILVQLGRLRPASDFDGMNVVRINGHPESLHSLVSRLESAGCQLDLRSTGWVNYSFDEPLARLQKRAEEAAKAVWNDRGIPLETSARSLGLMDIENREEAELVLPPTTFYARAERELAISGISCYQTFIQHIDWINRLLEERKRIRVLMLHPDSADLQMLIERERHPIHHDISAVLEVMRLHELHRNPGFEVRFMRRLPPFTAVMIDGDLAPSGQWPVDEAGEIRVQPGVLYGTQHRGLVMQLKKSPQGAFDFFANDFREHWSHAETLPEMTP